MKTEIQLSWETKARFFAQYRGQLILFHEDTNTISHICADFMTKRGVDIHCLLLKPLSSITDEDAIEVALICGFDRNKCDMVKVGKKIALTLIGESIETRCLRRMGYAVDYTLDYTLDYYSPFKKIISIAEQIELGWIKLRDNK